MTPSAVVTGIGVVSPNGLGTREFWDATCVGKSGIDAVSHFDATQYPSKLAGEVREFVAEEYLPGRLIPQTDRVTRLSLVAADWALQDAGLEPGSLDPFDMGVSTASSSGGFEFSQVELGNLWSQGSQYVSAYQSFAWFYAVNSGQISIRHGMKGPSGVVVTDQAGGLDSVANARRAIRKGTPVIVAGAVDASLCPWGWVGLQSSGMLSTTGEPSTAYLPFDDRACGHVAGEGGAILIMEAEDSARERGAPIYGSIAGYAATFDGPQPGLRKAIELALADAGMRSDDVDVVFADAAAVPERDREEAEALATVFGSYGVPVTAPKTMTGRLYSGAGALDLATALLAMSDGLIPPTVNVEAADRYELDLVGSNSRPSAMDVALILGRGYGGFNSAIIVESKQSTRHRN